MSRAAPFEKRIIGTETEYNLTVVTAEGEDHWGGSHPLWLPAGVESVGTFNTNGSRLYTDYGSLIEYATPETEDVEDIVHGEEAGERYIAHAALARMRADPSILRVVVHKRTATDKFYESGGGEWNDMHDIRSWGYHENYLVLRHHLTELMRDIVKAHLATRGLLVGSGYWRPAPLDLARMTPSQKHMDVKCDNSSATTRDKPLWNTRDEPHAHDHMARIHITSGDVNIAPWSTWMKLGSTSLAMRLGEVPGLGQSIRQLLPANMVRTAREVARFGFGAVIRLRNDQTVPAITIPHTLATACLKLADRLPDKDKVILAEWLRAIEDAMNDPTLLTDRTEWIARGARMRWAYDQLAANTGDLVELLEKLSLVDKLWDKMLPESDNPKRQGTAFRRRRQMAFPGYDPARSTKLITAPVPGTRAEERVRLMSAVLISGQIAGVGWDSVGSVQLPNPRGGNLQESLAQSDAK